MPQILEAGFSLKKEPPDRIDFELQRLWFRYSPFDFTDCSNQTDGLGERKQTLSHEFSLLPRYLPELGPAG